MTSENLATMEWLFPQGCAQIISVDSQFLRNTYLVFKLPIQRFHKFLSHAYFIIIDCVTYPIENGEQPECKKLHQFQNWSQTNGTIKAGICARDKKWWNRIPTYLLVYFQNILQKWQLFIMTSKNLAFSTRVCKNHFSGLSIFEKYIPIWNSNYRHKPTKHTTFSRIFSCFL